MKPQIINSQNSQKLKGDNTIEHSINVLLDQQSTNKIYDETGQKSKPVEKRDLNYHEIASSKVAAEVDNKLPILTPRKLQTPILNET